MRVLFLSLAMALAMTSSLASATVRCGKVKQFLSQCPFENRCAIQAAVQTKEGEVKLWADETTQIVLQTAFLANANYCYDIADPRKSYVERE